MILIQSLRTSVLLEDDKTGYRFYVDKKIYEEGDAQKIRDYAIPYSLPFDLITGLEIENKLYKVGVHTLYDILNNRRVVLGVLRNTELSVEHFIELVKGESNG